MHAQVYWESVIWNRIVILFQCAFAVREHIETLPILVDEIGDDVVGMEGRLENLAREKTPITCKGKVGCFDGVEIGWDLG